MDSGPEFDFVEAIHERYGTDSPVQETIMNKHNPDWDVLYPISSFLDTYRFELPANDFVWPRADFSVQETVGDGTRKLDLCLNFVSRNLAKAQSRLESCGPSLRLMPKSSTGPLISPRLQVTVGITSKWPQESRRPLSIYP